MKQNIKSNETQYKKMKTDVLIKKLVSLDDKYYNATINHSSKTLGFGYGMRAYSRVKHMSFKKCDNIRDTGKMIAKELQKRNEKIPYLSYLKISI